AGRALSRADRMGTRSHNDVSLERHELRHKAGESFWPPLAPPILDDDVLAFHITVLTQTLAKRGDPRSHQRGVAVPSRPTRGTFATCCAAAEIGCRKHRAIVRTIVRMAGATSLLIGDVTKVLSVARFVERCGQRPGRATRPPVRCTAKLGVMVRPLAYSS